MQKSDPGQASKTRGKQSAQSKDKSQMMEDEGEFQDYPSDG